VDIPQIYAALARAGVGLEHGLVDLRGASARGQSVFLLGGDPGVAKRAADVFRHRYPGLEIAGTTCPPVGSRKNQPVGLFAAISWMACGKHSSDCSPTNVTSSEIARAHRFSSDIA
jgi:hypothetical protein